MAPPPTTTKRWRVHVLTSAGTNHLLLAGPESRVAELRGEKKEGEGEPSTHVEEKKRGWGTVPAPG